jgi:hypothetical protein
MGGAFIYNYFNFLNNPSNFKPYLSQIKHTPKACGDRKII